MTSAANHAVVTATNIDSDAASASPSALRASLLQSLISTPALLSRLGDLAERPHLHSSRSRRACVAIILRLKHPDDPLYAPLAIPKPKIKVERKPKTAAKAAAASSTPLSSAAATSATTAAVSTPADAALAVASQAQVLSPATAHKLASAAASPFAGSTHSHAATPAAAAASTAAPEVDTYTRRASSIPAATIAQTRSKLLQLSRESWVQQSNLEVLFMQRALNPTDRWSGQMSFPGGRSDPGETDESTVIREVREEIGWDLSDSSTFVPLGQLDDKPMDGLKNVKPLAVSIFVFLQLARTSPRLCLEPSEVSAILFVPLSYFLSLHRAQDFGKIYHPLMLQILQPRAKELHAATAPSSTSGGSTTVAASTPAAALRSFDLRLIGYPHKREGKPLREFAMELLSAEQALALQRMEASSASHPAVDDHISELDEAPLAPAAAGGVGLQQLRQRLQHLAHEFPLPSSPLPIAAANALRARLPHLPPRPHFLPSLDQLASLRFPALSLPGVWVSAQGSGGVSTQDDMRVVVRNLLPSSIAADGASSSATTVTAAVAACPPPFILWGMTLEKTCELLLFLGHPFMFDFFQRGSEKRRRLYTWWSNVGEMRWNVERQVESLRHRITPSDGGAATTITAASGAAPSGAPATSATNAPALLSPSPFSSPVLFNRLRDVVQPAKQRVSAVWQRQKQRMMFASKL